MTIIIDNIITPYEIVRYNEINKVVKGNFEVWFHRERKGIRDRKYFPKTFFKFRIFRNKNMEIIRLLHEYKHKIERIICCGWDSFAYWYALWFCKKYKIRFTLWSGSTTFEKSFQRAIFLPLVKFIIKGADDYIAYGTRAKEYLIKLGAREDKIKIFLNSVDVDYFHKEALRLRRERSNLRGKYAIAKKDTVFLYVGQLIERKGIKELVEAFKKISSLNNQMTLVVVGEGVLRKKIELFIKNYPEIKIRSLGYLEYNKLPEIYALSDALVLPSKEEVWGLVVNEALASGIPVLVSKSAGCSVDLVDKDNGEVIEEVSEKGIARIIKRFLKKKKYMISLQVLERMRNEKYAKEIFIR